MAGSSSGEATYSPTARRFHWWTVALILVQIPLGLYMSYRGNVQSIFDAHHQLPLQLAQAGGLIILSARAGAADLSPDAGAPADEPTIEAWQKGAAHATHWPLYLLLIAVPIGGWLGVSYYGARDVLRAVLAAGADGGEPGYGQQGVLLPFPGAMGIVLLVGAHSAARCSPLHPQGRRADAHAAGGGQAGLTRLQQHFSRPYRADAARHISRDPELRASLLLPLVPAHR